MDYKMVWAILFNKMVKLLRPGVEPNSLFRYGWHSIARGRTRKEKLYLAERFAVFFLVVCLLYDWRYGYFKFSVSENKFNARPVNIDR